MKDKKLLGINIETFTSELKKHKLKATSQRIAVHKAMLALGHASADMVADYISKNKLAGITLASVYNTLCQMAVIGIYSYRHSSTSKMFFDVNSAPHFHIYDRDNDTYIDIVDDELLSSIERKLKKTDFGSYQMYGFELNILCNPVEN